MNVGEAFPIRSGSGCRTGEAQPVFLEVGVRQTYVKMTKTTTKTQHIRTTIRHVK